MNLSTPGTLGRLFRRNVEMAYRHEQVRHETMERERREKRQEAESDATEFMDFAMAVVTMSELDDFRFELDGYDTATIAALQQNETDLAGVRERLNNLLAKAHVMPDGRRVFKTEDGLRVFDEHGIELSGGEINPVDIDDQRPRWETYQAERDRMLELKSERAELLDYQSKLDDARERLSDGEISREEFDDLRDAVREDMPRSVRAQLEPDELGAQVAKDTRNDEAYELELSPDEAPIHMARSAPSFGLDS